MLFKFELEGGNFSKAGYASSQIKKVLKQLAIDPRIIKRVVVALYEAEVNIVAHAWRGTVVAELDADKISLELTCYNCFIFSVALLVFCVFSLYKYCYINAI